MCFSFFFFNDTATTEIYTLSLHDALPISRGCPSCSATMLTPKVSSSCVCLKRLLRTTSGSASRYRKSSRSEEHTSELQSQSNLVCRLLLEKKKKQIRNQPSGGRNAHDDAC